MGFYFSPDADLDEVAAELAKIREENLAERDAEDGSTNNDLDSNAVRDSS